MTPPAGTEPAHPLRCAICPKMSVDERDVALCDGKVIPVYAYRWIETHGCASHRAIAQPKFTSTELLLLANDEWKRREERRHLHENVPWCIGFISGFLTDKKWAREYVDKLLKGSEGK